MNGTEKRKNVFQEVVEELESRGWSVADHVRALATDEETSGLDELFDRKKSLWDKITLPFWRFCYFLRDGLFNANLYKRKWTKLRHGYDPADSWGIDYSMAKWAVPRLKHLRNNLHGCPADFVSQARPTEEEIEKAMDTWEGILDKIIWAFEFYIDENSDYAGTKEWDRWKDGMNLFVEYYRNLWD